MCPANRTPMDNADDRGAIIPPLDFSPSPCTTFDSHAEQWDSLLGHQAALLCDAEFSWLSNYQPWILSQRVVDVGCGNGDYLAALQQSFAGKLYLGTDTSTPLIAIAMRKHAHRGLSFAHSGQANPLKQFLPDTAVLRFVVQHLSSPQSFFDELAIGCPSLNNTFLIEPDLQASGLTPDISILSKLLQRHEEHTQTRGHSRTSMTTLGGLAKVIGSHWTIAKEALITVAHLRNAWADVSISGALDGWKSSLAYLCNDEELALLSKQLDQWCRVAGQELKLSVRVWHLERNQHH